jgi:transcriptional regulator with XRE-family HTH domain
MATLEEQFGALVRYHRKRAGLSQAQLAEKIDRQTNAVQRLENGETSPTFDTVVRLAEALDIDVWELFKVGDYSARPGRDDTLATIFKQLVGIKEAELQKINDLITVALKLGK